MENSRFAVISDSSCDLPGELTAAKEITVVPFYVSFDGETYKKEGTEIGIREFYREMVEQPGVYPKSSMPSIQDYVDVFQPFAQAHIPVLCICITTKFSGSMQSALNAKEMVLSQYEDAQIEVIDATVNTVLQGLFVLEAVSMREEGDDPFGGRGGTRRDQGERPDFLYDRKHGLSAARRKNRESGRSRGFCAGDQAHHYPEAGRDISKRNIEEQEKIDR